MFGSFVKPCGFTLVHSLHQATPCTFLLQPLLPCRSMYQLYHIILVPFCFPGLTWQISFNETAWILQLCLIRHYSNKFFYCQRHIPICLSKIMRSIIRWKFGKPRFLLFFCSKELSCFIICISQEKYANNLYVYYLLCYLFSIIKDFISGQPVVELGVSQWIWRQKIVLPLYYLKRHGDYS